MTELRIAIAGLGNVGAATLNQLLTNVGQLQAAAGRPIKVMAVHARDKKKQRACTVPDNLWDDEPLKWPTRPDIDAVVELVGGASGLALDLAKATLDNKKILITANKAMIAKHGSMLAGKLKQGGQLCAEAMVAGAIPVLKTMREALAANKFASVQGILNGTCNYILSQMFQNNLPYDVALKQAQAEGYAEADPTLDVGGGDTAHKLSILAGVALQQPPTDQNMVVEGISAISPLDLSVAADLGYRIKLLGVAQNMPEGLAQWVAPCLVPVHNLLAQVQGAENAVLLQTNLAGPLLLSGRGAGPNPTASAVLADIVDAARGNVRPWFNGANSTPMLAPHHGTSRFYLRFMVADEAGVVAKIAYVLAAQNISIASLLQRDVGTATTVPIVITTHITDVLGMHKAREILAQLPFMHQPPCVMRILD